MRPYAPDLDDLQILVTVAARGSIGQAATELGLTQPSASRRMAVLERSLRVQLLHRGTRGSSLTPSGRVVVDWATALLRAADQFKESVDSLGQERDTQLHAAVSMTIAEQYAPRWLAKVRDQSPETVVRLSMGNSSEVMDMVESERVDIGLIESPLVRASLHSLKIGFDDLVVAVLPEHPWASAPGVSPAELSSIGLLVREHGSGARETLDRALAATGHEVTASIELASNTALKSAALAGMGPVVLPAIALSHELQSGALVEVKSDGIRLTRPLTVVWTPASSPPRQAVSLFLSAARSDRRARGSRTNPPESKLDPVKPLLQPAPEPRVRGASRYSVA